MSFNAITFLVTIVTGSSIITVIQLPAPRAYGFCGVEPGPCGIARDALHHHLPVRGIAINPALCSKPGEFIHNNANNITCSVCA
eukprot:CAMPEP_0117870894 /NCGR_PEP_ID=MMETSP0950-20121206/10140_1 /TAXON_ID=44440 /ORGANISM="Chattonella subsalsa, Strain CCMP2191" /LENGTH=83 /DNA_ID=CAMNT_0005723325 /DNA_START=728 /DNA_END=975 /DNA_ORIENTATION=+